MNSIQFANLLHCIFSKLDVNCSTSVYNKPYHLLIVVTCHPVTPPISKHCFNLLKNKQTAIPAIINIENLRETVTQVYSLSRQQFYHVCQLETAKQMFYEEPPCFPSNSGSHVFPIIHLVMTCLFCKCSKNVLEFFRTFIELAGSKKY